jgi:membrane protein
MGCETNIGPTEWASVLVRGQMQGNDPASGTEEPGMTDHSVERRRRQSTSESSDSESSESTSQHARIPSPDDPVKPDSPTDLTMSSWVYVSRKTVREFLDDRCIDLAAALTYYAVLALFPALIALLSLVGLVGRGPDTVDTLLGILEDVAGGSVAQTLEGPLTSMSTNPSASLGFIVGLVVALWSASGYVSAFGRAMNQIYEVEEGRPIWKLRPVILLITIVTVVLAAAVALGLVVSGPVAQSIGSAIGLGSTVVLLWNVAKWPALLFFVILLVALLYYGTPNVKQPKFRWVSVGSVLAIVVWILASLAFGFYVANFSSYDATYGSLGGVVVFLLWLWLTNLALLFGAELDAELERGRQLQAGMPAEETLQLPPRDTSKIEKTAAKRQDDIERGRRLRESRGATTDVEEGPDHPAPRG